MLQQHPHHLYANIISAAVAASPPAASSAAALPAAADTAVTISGSDMGVTMMPPPSSLPPHTLPSPGPSSGISQRSPFAIQDLLGLPSSNQLNSCPMPSSGSPMEGLYSRTPLLDPLSGSPFSPFSPFHQHPVSGASSMLGLDPHSVYRNSAHNSIHQNTSSYCNGK